MRTLKLLLTSKNFRWAILEKLKLKLVSLPGIKDAIAYYQVYKFNKKTKGKDNWDRYVLSKKYVNSIDIRTFIMQLLRLQACMMAEGNNEELFEDAKSNILGNEIINEARFKEFKDWLESIDSTEKNYSKIQELITSLSEQK